MRACFLSDLHLLSPRSMAAQWATAIEAAFQDCQLIVLGGDIFDFRWSLAGSHQATLVAAHKWLIDLIKRHSHCQIVYLLGNHDSHPDLVKVLAGLTTKHSTFQWFPGLTCIGDSLFCHGDVLDAGSVERLSTYRRKFQHERPASRTAHTIYDAAVAMRLHRTIPQLFHRPRATCMRLSELLAIADLPDSSTIRRVFFGHTHVPIYELQIGPLQFFNPGAALRHMNFAPINFEISTSSIRSVCE